MSRRSRGGRIQFYRLSKVESLRQCGPNQLLREKVSYKDPQLARMHRINACRCPVPNESATKPLHLRAQHGRGYGKSVEPEARTPAVRQCPLDRTRKRYPGTCNSMGCMNKPSTVSYVDISTWLGQFHKSPPTDAELQVINGLLRERKRERESQFPSETNSYTGSPIPNGHP